MLEGELELRHGDKECTLDTGDAVYFDAGTPHSYQCAGKRAARVIIVTMHQPPQAMPMRASSTTPGLRTMPGAKAGAGEEKAEIL